MTRPLAHAFSLILLAGLAACDQAGGGAVAAATGGRPQAAQLTPVSGASPFRPGCFPETVQPFGTDIEDAEMETNLAIDPLDPDHMTAVWMQDTYGGLVSAVSRDGGRHWEVSPIPGSSACSGGDYDIAADPTVGYGPDGTRYFAGFSLDLPTEEAPLPQRTRLFTVTSPATSDDWAKPVSVSAGFGTLHDMPTIRPDPRMPCVAYLTWTDEYTAFGPASIGLMFARTDDCGASWSTPVTVFTPTGTAAPFTVAMGSKLLPMRDGSLVIVATAMSNLLETSYPELPDTGPDSIVAFRSTDGGTTWSAAQHVAAFVNGPFHDPDTDEKVLASPYILSASVSPDGAGYVTWRQQLTETTADIRMARTDDGGASWSDAIVVRASGTQMMTPTVAAGRDGEVAITYYDIRNDRLADAGLTADVWISISRDGGATFEESHLGGPFDLGAAAYLSIPAEGLMVGEYAGLVATDEGYAATFAMSGEAATAGASDVFFTKIRSKKKG